MYRKHFGLLRKPFESSPDADTFFLGEIHKEVLIRLRRDLAAGRTLLLLTGAEGSGKTSLVNVLAPSLKMRGCLCRIADPVLDVAEFFSRLADQFGLQFDGNKAKFLVRFAKFLGRCRETGKKIVLIIDHAQAQPIEILEELRLLANLATEIRSLLSIFLVGRPELLHRLPREQLFLLHQRIAVRHHLGDLSREDCRRYIQFRLNLAGAREGEVFPWEAVKLIYQATGGNPGKINSLCNATMIAAYSRGIAAIDQNLVRRSARRLHVQGKKAPPFLAAEQTAMDKWLAWSIGALLVAEGAGTAFAYQKGWFVPFCQYLMKSIKLR